MRNIYPREFKLRALELLESSGKTVRQISIELGVAENNLYNWRREHSANVRDGNTVYVIGN